MFGYIRSLGRRWLAHERRAFAYETDPSLLRGDD